MDIHVFYIYIYVVNKPQHNKLQSRGHQAPRHLQGLSLLASQVEDVDSLDLGWSGHVATKNDLSSSQIMYSDIVVQSLWLTRVGWCTAGLFSKATWRSSKSKYAAPKTSSMNKSCPVIWKFHGWFISWKVLVEGMIWGCLYFRKPLSDSKLINS